VDWWSFGCFVAELLQGRTPFDTSEARALHSDTRRALDLAAQRLEPRLDGRFVSGPAAELVLSLLQKDPATRLGAGGAEEVMRHPWFETVDWEGLARGTVTAP